MAIDPGSAAETAAPRPTWRELAVARSLDPARVRAEQRVQRFLDAAHELMLEDSEKEFTVQDVVERSGQSLRSFYQYFAGKHELLLAVFEESVRSTTDHLREVVAAEEAPLDRLHRFVVEYFRLCRPARKDRPADAGPAPVMVEFGQQLLTAHPKEAARAFEPLVALCDELLDAAVAGDVLRVELRRPLVSGVVLEAIMFNTFATTIGGATRLSDADAAEELWDFLLHGFGVPPS